MTAVATLRSIVLECAAPEPVATFWSRVLDRAITTRDSDWWALERPEGGPRIAFQVVAGHVPPPWPGATGEQQIHLDIEVDDLRAAAKTVVDLGATTLSEIVDEDQDDQWQVFADPAGHPFCLVRI